MINNIPHKDLNDQKVEGNEGRPADFVDDLTFWQKTKVGRFLSLRTKTSKAVLSILTVVGSSFLPPPIGTAVNSLLQTAIPNASIMELLTDMSLIQIVITVVGFLVVTGVPLLFKGVRDLAVWTVIKSRVDLLADELVKAVDSESAGGKKITKGEISDIIQSVIKGKGEKPS